MTDSTDRRKVTHTKIRQAIVRIEKGRPKVVSTDRKMSILAVAEEADVSDALIHNEYPDLLERIRGLVGKSVNRQRDKKHQALKAERVKNKDLRGKIAELKKDKQNLASKNATMSMELKQLRAIVASDNVSPFKPKKL